MGLRSSSYNTKQRNAGQMFRRRAQNEIVWLITSQRWNYKLSQVRNIMYYL